MSVDGLGNPLPFALTGGQCHDISQAAALLIGLKAEHVIGDKGIGAGEGIRTLDFLLGKQTLCR